MSEHDGALPLPVDALNELLARYGDLMLVGARARDHIVITKAGLDLGRATYDLDLALGVPSLDDFAAMTSVLGDGGATGMRFRVRGVPVDLIPFSPTDAFAQPLTVGDGIQMNTEGMAEAFASAECDNADLPGLRYPTLQALIVLKTIAWTMRGSGTAKDADDVALLLRCVDHGSYEERCYTDLLGARWADGDPRRVGAYIVGRDAARDLPRATAMCIDTWRSTPLREACSATSVAGLSSETVCTMMDALIIGAEDPAS